MEKKACFFDVTERVVMCDNCGHPVMKSEVDGNNGSCPNCNEIFHPFEYSFDYHPESPKYKNQAA